MSDIIAVAVQSLEIEFNSVERHLLIHGVQSSDYHRNAEDDSSYTVLVFGDDKN